MLQTAAEATAKEAKVEVANLTKVLERKGQELEDVIAEDQAKPTTAQQDRDSAQAVAATLREELAALKLQHAKELAAEKEASAATILGIQQEKTSFEAFVREMSRQLLVPERGEPTLGANPRAWRVRIGGQSPSVASPPWGPVPERGESGLGASPRAWRVRIGGQSPSVASPPWGPVPERGESADGKRVMTSPFRAGTCDFVEMATPHDCLETATKRIIKCTGDILAALQYISPSERIPRDAQSVFHAVTDVPAVVDWLRRSSCCVGVTMDLSLVLAHYSEGFDVDEVTAGFPSETGEFDVAEVLRLMDVVRPFADRVLATADLETHITSQTAPGDVDVEGKPKDFPAKRLFHAAANSALSTYPVVKYMPKFVYVDDGAEPVVGDEAGSSK
ncbi:hypothetical protein QYE76_026926 [Lolium multiflorum]|uniref:Uncharacterized protein n=1 Tax=Lolium multiflorum TaxID=4521 RepID=A0AAD8VW26_LOLMU|nr:hypothetical protein QYE76_026926 [Lolium multiflorum]